MSTNSSINNELEKVDSMNPKALEEFAQKKSAILLEKIQNAFDEIRNYEKSPEEKAQLDGAKQHIKNFFTGGDFKRDMDITAIQNNISRMKADSAAAMLNIMTIIQESLMFTCSSVKLANQMHSAMAVMMTRGFVDSNGNIRELDENTREFANYILRQADLFVYNQNEYEEKLDSLEDAIDKIRKINDLQGTEISQVKDENERNKEKIKYLAKEVKKNDERIDKYEEDINKQKEINKAGAKKDEAQDKEILRQAQKDKEHDEILARHEKKDREFETAFKYVVDKEEKQDELLSKQTEKDLEHDRRLDESEKRDKIQNELLNEQKKKDKEHDKKIEEGEIKDLEQDNQISSNLEKINRLEKHIKELEGVIEIQKTRIDELNVVLSKSQNKEKMLMRRMWRKK